VAGSVALKRGKLLSNEFSAFKYSSFTLPLAHKSFSMAAAEKKLKFRTLDTCKVQWSILAETRKIVATTYCSYINSNILNCYFYTFRGYSSFSVVKHDSVLYCTYSNKMCTSPHR